MYRINYYKIEQNFNETKRKYAHKHQQIQQNCNCKSKKKKIKFKERKKYKSKEITQENKSLDIFTRTSMLIYQIQRIKQNPSHIHKKQKTNFYIHTLEVNHNSSVQKRNM